MIINNIAHRSRPDARARLGDTGESSFDNSRGIQTSGTGGAEVRAARGPARASTPSPRAETESSGPGPSPVYSSSPARAGDGITLRSSAACGFCLSAACSEHIFNSVRICRAKTRIYSAKRSLCCDPQGGCEPLNLIGRAPGSDAPVAAVAAVAEIGGILRGAAGRMIVTVNNGCLI